MLNAAGEGWRAWLQRGWLLAGSTAVCAVVSGIFSFPSLPGTQPRPALSRQLVSPVPVAVHPQLVSPAPGPATPAGNGATAIEVADDVSPQDVDVIADLDNLVAREETNVWTGDDTSRF